MQLLTNLSRAANCMTRGSAESDVIEPALLLHALPLS
jgi:hypothetical protein